MKDILGWYERHGARIVLLTATPVNMGKWADHLIVSGTLAEWRKQGALVPIYTHSISQPDLKKVAKKRSNEGEFVLSAAEKMQFVQHIVGEVVESYETLHETNGGTFAYAPCVKSSAWLAEQFRKRGHRFTHIDATYAIIDGEEKKLSRSLWRDIVGEMKDGRTKGLTCRFKAREGIDIQSADHCILATPVGSLASYLQIIGRVMRASPETSKTHAVLQDHGGVFHGQGSPNHDREWESLWKLSDHAASTFHMDNMKEGVTPEPIRCWKCGMERLGGDAWPKCGEKSKRSTRLIREESGELRKVEGGIVERVRRIKRPDTEQLWSQMFYGFRNKKVERSFAQMEGFFYQQHGYRPTRDLKFMPRWGIDWKSKVHEVPMDRLIGTSKGKVT